jgi:hypothetical protein
MRRNWIAAAVMGIVTGVAIAKLPPPTPEQAQAAAAKKEEAKASAEKQKQLLEKAQDRVVQHYKRTKGAGGGAAVRGGRTETTNISDHAVRQAPGDAGPKGGTKQSAEAHSAPAK